MAHRVSNYLEVFGNPACVNAFERLQSRLASLAEPEPCWTGEAAEAGILGPAPESLLQRQIRPWPKWIAYESQAAHMVVFGSANWPVEELQDALMVRLLPIDSAVMVRLQWHNWPTGCGARLAFGFQGEVVALAAERIFSPEELATMDEADIMWQCIEACTQDVDLQVRQHPWWQAHGLRQTGIHGED